MKPIIAARPFTCSAKYAYGPGEGSVLACILASAISFSFVALSRRSMPIDTLQVCPNCLLDTRGIGRALLVNADTYPCV